MKRIAPFLMILALFTHLSFAIQTPLINLKEGNLRFQAGNPIHYNPLAELKKNLNSQHPNTVVLSCMDSRVPPQIVFNQKLGSMFVIRNAGNVEDPDVLASLEYATEVVKTPLIVVMGHTHCGAMAAACTQVKLGNITQLTAKLQPAVIQAEKILHSHNCSNPKLISEIAKQNVYNQINQILYLSPTVAKLVKEKKVTIKGALFNLATGKANILPAQIK